MSFISQNFPNVCMYINIFNMYLINYLSYMIFIINELCFILPLSNIATFSRACSDLYNSIHDMT